MPTNYDKYLEKLKRPFFKLCRLRFLNPDNSVAFALDNNPKGERNKTFISNGSLSVNLQNGQRRSVDVTLSNVNNEYDYNVNNLWFGTEIALDEGLILDDGTEFYIQQGIFLIDTPEDSVEPNNRTVSLNLVDKWANIDGTLYGNLEGTYEVAVGTNIYTPISALLSEDKGNGRAVDNVNPVFTDYYNSMTQTLPDGTTVQITASPYTLTLNDGTIADVVLGLCEMVNAWVGYDESGALRIDPSQDDITDITKPVLWSFSQNESTLLGMSYSVKNTEVYNDYIVVGEQLDDYTQPKGRAQNLDPKSPTNINIIGKKTLRETASGYSTDRQCIDRAVWKLKRSSVLQRAVNISCSQIMHIKENSLVEIIRTDKTNSPIERHLVQGFSRPLASDGNMTISAISVSDYDIATIVQDSSRVLFLESVEYITYIPTDTVCASILSIGGNSLVVNQEVVSAEVDEVEVVGRNIWDEDWIICSPNDTTGNLVITSSGTRVGSKNYIPVIPGQTYFGRYDGTANIWAYLYDENYNYLGSSAMIKLNLSPTLSLNARYMKFYMPTAYGNIYKNDICINLSGYSNGEYSPYTKTSITIPSAITSLDGYGQSNGSDVNYVDYAEKKYHYFGKYVGGSWVSSTETITDISEYLDDSFLENIPVEAGGTITYKADDDYHLPVPVKNKFLIHSSDV